VWERVPGGRGYLGGTGGGYLVWERVPGVGEGTSVVEGTSVGVGEGTWCGRGYLGGKGYLGGNITEALLDDCSLEANGIPHVRTITGRLIALL